MITGYQIVQRFFSTVTTIKPKICIVGSGPAGFYAAQHLIKKLNNTEIDILERLPVPFGLVRFGVAPDHPEVKNVINTFTKTAQHPNINYYGNINLGKDVSLKQLQESYHIVLLTYGAENNRTLNIPGESLKNVILARNIVGWYNGLPSDKDLKINLSGKTVAILGQGNVAIDIARILLSPIDELKKTDITQYSLDQIAASNVKKIYLIGRRGPLQAAFTIKELREMIKLNQCQTNWRKTDFNDINDNIIQSLARPRKRITELMMKSLGEMSDLSNCDDSNSFNPIFYRSPLEILGENKVQNIVLGVTELEGEEMLNRKAVLTSEREVIDCDLVIPSIGYKSIQADINIPFDSKRGIVKNTNGKVTSGLYTAGWLSTGPLGVILTTMTNSFGVAETIVKDMNSDSSLLNDEIKPGFDAIRKILENKNVQIVNWAGWEKIDKYEIDQGKLVGKPREKLVDINKMLEIAAS